ncbi:hypothetical protein SS50377_25282 [Spironucleus salmonicida]|uniref:Uncharacterized protein n=1 Tax=Spironucleus salmonicida TaxID=348837 RepID=V6LBN3_9EUKA|nr:hypothetical protein SS50377_25282 [Spironucleus salmonicida]|eukprot:EST41837.1 Hypothetical protein SS50377_18671 [Spironucleus salmonicida]
MQIPVSHINSSLVPAKSDVYSRQLAKQQQARIKEQQQREHLKQTKLQQEMLEVTGKPRINQNLSVNKPFNQRQKQYEEHSKKKYQILNEIQKQQQQKLTFNPKLNPASLYLAETRRALDIQASMLKTSNLQAIEDTHYPEITEYAASLKREGNIYDKLSQPRVKPGELLIESASLSEYAVKPNKQEQILHAEKMHSEYSRFLVKREVLKEQFDREMIGTCEEMDVERKVRRDVLAYKAKIREIQQQGSEKQQEAENYTFRPEINQISKLLTQEQADFNERYYDEIEQLKNRQIINQKKKELQEFEVFSFSPVTNTKNKHSDPDQSQIEFFERQEKLIEKKKNQQTERDNLRRLQENREIQYVQQNCNKSHTTKVPQIVKCNLLALDQDDRDNLATQLLDFDNLPEDQRRKTQRQLQLGGGVPLTTAYLMDSIASHSERVKRAREDRLNLQNKLKLRE